MLIYLAGAISIHYKNYEVWKCKDWRRSAKHFIEDIFEIGEVFDPTINFDENLLICNERSVVAQNRYYLENSDLVIVNLSSIESSPGTIWEIFIAKELGIPVIAYNDSEWYKSPHVSEAITIKFNSMADAITHINSMYHKRI